MEAARWWLPLERCGETGPPKEGARPARERRASDQLKPSPKGRRDTLDLSSGGEVGVLAEDRVVTMAEPAGGERRGPTADGGG